MTADSFAYIDETWKRYVPAQDGLSADLKHLRFEKERVLSSSLLRFSPSIQNLSKQMDVSDCFNVNTFLPPLPLFPFPPFLPLVFTHVICLASALGTSKTMRTFSCHRYPLMCPFWVGSLNCLLNKTLTSSPQPCPYSILASQLYWQKCLSTHFYGGLKEIDYYCAQIKWESNATPVWLSCNWSELYTGAICNIFSKLNFFLFGFYWCMFRCPLGLPFFQWKLQHVNFHTNYSNSRYLYLIHYNRSNQG